MATFQVNLVVNQGSDYSFDLPVLRDESKSPVNLTDYTISAQIRKHYGAYKYHSFTATVKSPATNGVINLTLTDIQTKKLDVGRYVYDVVITSNAGTKTKAFEGLVTVVGGATI